MGKSKQTEQSIAIDNAADKFLLETLLEYRDQYNGNSAKVKGITDVPKAHTYIAENRGRLNFWIARLETRIASRGKTSTASVKQELFG